MGGNCCNCNGGAEYVAYLCWFKNWVLLEYTKIYHKNEPFFKLKKNERCLGFFYMGKYDHVNTESKLRKSIIEKTEWNL